MDGLATLKNQSIFNLTKIVIDKFSGEIRARRIERGYSQLDLSKMSNVSIRQISYIESGNRDNVSMYIMLQLSRPLDYYEWLSGLFDFDDLETNTIEDETES